MATSPSLVLDVNRFEETFFGANLIDRSCGRWRSASEKDRRCGESEQVKVGIQDGRSLWVWNLIESVVSEFGAVASVLGCVGGWAGVQVWLLLLS